MKSHNAWVELSVGAKSAQAYFCAPTTVQGTLPGVVVLQEAWGVDPFIQDVTERFAQAGYAAIAPDLFSYGGKPPALAPERVEAVKDFLDTVPQSAWFDAAQRATALAALTQAQREPLEESLALLLVPTRPWDQYLAVVRAAEQRLAEGVAKGRKLGAVGFCMGGALALRHACTQPQLGAAVVFYGMTPPAELLPGLRAPVLGLYAEKDPHINAGVPALADALRQQGQHFEHHVYPGTLHAFFNDTRGNYHTDASRDAWARTLSFLATHLTG